MQQRSGLNPGWSLLKPGADAAKRRAGLAASAKQLNRTSDKTGRPEGLGPISAAPARLDADPALTFGHVCAAGNTGPVGLEFRAPVRYVDKPQPWARASGARQRRRDEIGLILEDARVFAGGDHRGFATDLRSMVTRVIAPAAGLQEPIRLLSIGASPLYASDQLSPSVDLSTVGHDLNVDIEQVDHLNIGELEVRLSKVVSEHTRLETLRRTARALGSSGWIDATAERVLASSGIGLLKVLELLRNCSVIELGASIGGPPRLRVRLQWREGVVTASFRTLENDLRYSPGVLEIRNASLPETLLAALPGRPLGALLQHPLVPPDPLIKSAGWDRGRLEVTVEETASLIDANIPQPGATR